MISICEVCGVSTEMPDEELERHPIRFDCVGCGTSYYATRVRCGRITRRANGSKGRHFLRVAEEATDPDDDRLSDLRAIARQSSLPPPPPCGLDVLDAPPSLREAIRLSDPPLPPPVTWTPEVSAAEPDPDALRARAHKRSVAFGAAFVLALAVLTSATRPADRKDSARTGVEVTALAARGRVLATPIGVTPRAEEAAVPAIKPVPLRRAAPAQPRGEPLRPPVEAARPAGETFGAPNAAPEAAAPAPKPMSLQEAIAIAAGKPAPRR